MAEMADCQRALSSSVCLYECVCYPVTICVWEGALYQLCVCTVWLCVIRGGCVASVCPLYLRIDGLFYTLPRIMYTWLLASHPSSNAIVCVCACVCVCVCDCVCVCVHVCVSLQIYRILGKTVVCYPIVFDLSDFYLSQDVMLLIDDIKVSPGHTFGSYLCCDSESACRLNKWDIFTMSDPETCSLTFVKSTWY